MSKDLTPSQTATDAAGFARYRGPIVDAHTHLWALGSGNYPWLESGGGLGLLSNLDAIRTDYLPGDYLAEARDAGEDIVATVHVEALWDAAQSPLAETRWLESLDRPEGIAGRYVAAAPFGRDDSRDIIDAQAAFARVSGIRQVIQWHPDPAKTVVADEHMIERPEWRESARHAASRGLVLDVLMFPWQASHVAEAAAALPQLTFVIDHAGSPVDRSPEGTAVWERGLELMAEQPNVHVKVSALGVPDDDPRWGEGGSFAYLIGRLVAAFGTERAMFASDYPVGRLKNTFADIYARFHAFAEALPEAGGGAVFHNNARWLSFSER